MQCKKKDGLPSLTILMKEGIKTLRRENNKIVEEGIKKTEEGNNKIVEEEKGNKK